MSEHQPHISEEKKKVVENLNDLIKNKKTILIASIKSIPGSQFQEISKKLRGKAIVKVPKKNLIFRALDNSSNEVVKELKDKIEGSVAILFSDIDSFELAAELMQNQSAIKAKPGQEAPEDIVIQAGPTELVPGPAISELGALGIQIQIDKGKITIKESKVIAAEGTKISENAADLMNKLGMKPFSVGFLPLASFDAQENKIYTEIKINREETLAELKTSFGKALSFAVNIGYTTPDTINFLLQKAGRDANKINRIMTGEPEPVAEVQAEAPKEESKEEKKEEPKQDASAGLASLFG